MELTARRSIEAIWRIESARIIAGLARFVRDLDLAEELAQDALVAACEQWPQEGVPNNPGAWLMGTAKHYAIDRLRRRSMQANKHDRIAQEAETTKDLVDEVEELVDEDVGDDLLRLIFVACHPVLTREARVALTLRLLGGLTTDEIARAFLVSETTIAQRIVRAKRSLSDARVPFVVPTGLDRGVRLASVLEVIYLVFNEGYSATAGDDVMRPGLCEDALRLGRILANLAPAEPEAHGLVALMEIHSSRAAARVGANGEPILLADQNRAHWDRMAINRGFAALERARELGGAQGSYALQAAIAACHARAPSVAETDWPAIVELYGALATVLPSPVVELNRALAVSMAQGPEAGLRLLDVLASDTTMTDFPPLHAARGNLLEKLGRREEARIELLRAASLTRNEPQRQSLLAHAEAVAREA